MVTLVGAGVVIAIFSIVEFGGFAGETLGSTTVTRKRDDETLLVAGKKHVGNEAKDGGVIGDDEAEELVELSDASETRDTTKRFRDGLGMGLATGEGIGDGAGERRRPPVVRFGSSIVVLTLTSPAPLGTVGERGSV